jgi:hypothetical protein
LATRGLAYLDAKFLEVRVEIEALETRLLTQFWKWGRTADQRTRRIEQSDANDGGTPGCAGGTDLHA